MSLGKLEILSLFKDNMLQFIDNLVELCPEEGELIMFRILFENQLPIEDTMIRLAKVILPIKEMIIKKNEKFFLEGNDIFGNVKQEKIIKWKQLWLKKNLDSQDREMIWKWLQLFLGLSEMYYNNEKKLGIDILQK